MTLRTREMAQRREIVLPISFAGFNFPRDRSKNEIKKLNSNATSE